MIASNKVLRHARTILVLSAFGFLVSCQDGTDSLFPKAERPIPDKLVKAMKAKGMTRRSPILLRIYKQENTLEVWKRKDNGRYDMLKSYEICKWSGKLGPKFKEGDRQAPEGFYTVAPAQMNPRSSYHLSFNMGFPNRYDRSHKRTGTHLMVHGACSSAGCYSMTDELIEEIYAMAREAFKGGQRNFQIQAYPFRMTPENMVRHEGNPHYDFWKMLKVGSDHFEITKIPPKVDVCDKKYVFNRKLEDGTRFHSMKACPETTISPKLQTAYLEKSQADLKEMDEIRKKAEQKEKLKEILGSNQQTSSKVSQERGNENNNLEIVKVDPNQPSNIPIPRPVLPGEEPAQKKKPKGLFSWLRPS